jgi:GH25 family lysozyme M1 (1,4-beta-N-acetylmuramidase)
MVAEPELPPGAGWLFWQLHHRGRVAGISGSVDLDVFHADREALDRL